MSAPAGTRETGSRAPVVQRAAESDTAGTLTRSILQELFGPPAERSFDVRLWDGSVDRGRAPARFTLVIARPGALRRMFLPPSELSIGEGIVRGDVDIEGDFEAAMDVMDLLPARLASPLLLGKVLLKLVALPTDDAAESDVTSRDPALSGRLHSRRRDQQAVRSHYDVGNDFYALWLDRRMVYSCAYFETGTEDIDTAQEAKLDLICRKLRLQAGERLLDIGCGWGALICHAAQHYGVHALGITLSPPQAELARKRVADLGLTNQCRVEVCDYRDFHGQPFDKVVSVGMFEHVGRARMSTYFDKAFELTKPGGLFLNHGIVIGPATPHGLRGLAERLIWKSGSFINTYVFPDGELLHPGEVLQFSDSAGFEVRDLENLREHYTRTLRHWVRRLEQHRDEAIELAGEQTYRVWRAYMSGSAHAFRMANIGVVQLLLSRVDPGGAARLPLTRNDIYLERR
jgi:cyclopropane-fatty-acyl-phospholipid synthase